MKRLLVLLLLPVILWAKQIDTFYGSIEVEESVLLELIDCEAMQRLKEVHQYGVSYYTTHREEYSRYDHSLGVFAILRKRGAPLKEQIAGLLHDVSHTIFSHVGDWIFGVEYAEKDYQNRIHAQFLQERGIGEILEKYGFSVEEVQPTQNLFPALECPLPSLCADRIDYNIQGVYYQGFLTYDEALTLFHELKYTNGIWISENLELMKKLARFSFFMSENCWGSPTNFFQSQWLSDAILRAYELGDITDDQIHFGKDHSIWQLLLEHTDPFIREKMHLLSHADETYDFESHQKADRIIKTKFRGIDPWICTLKGNFLLSELDPEIAAEFSASQRLHQCGWSIKLKTASIFCTES